MLYLSTLFPVHTEVSQSTQDHCQMHPGTLETMTSTETWKWMLCLDKSRNLHKSA